MYGRVMQGIVGAPERHTVVLGFESQQEMLELGRVKGGPSYAEFYGGNKWVGRDVANLSKMQAAIKGPWDDGLKVIDRYRSELASASLPQPVSRKRRTRFSEDDGHEIDLDRMRHGQPFWRTCRRENMAGPQTITIISDWTASSAEDSEDILWRGAASVVLTDMLEAAGYAVNLWAINCVTRAYWNGNHGIQYVPLKSASDPLDVSSLTNAVSGWYFRSAVFLSYYAGLEVEGNENTEVNDGTFGTPYEITDAVKSVIDKDAYVITDAFSFQAAAKKARAVLEQITKSSDLAAA